MSLPTSGSGVPVIEANFNSLTATAIAYLNSILAVASPLTLRSNDPTELPLLIQGAVGQTENLQEWQDSSGTVGAYLTAAGRYGIGAEAGGSSLWSNGGIVTITQSFNNLLTIGLYQNPQFNMNYRSQLGWVKYTLTDAAANNFCDVQLGSGEMCGGYFDVTLVASDGVDYQVRTQRLRVTAVNKGGVYTSAITVVDEAASVSAGTFTATWAIVTGANKITLQVTPTSSLVPTTLDCYANFSFPRGSILV